MAIISEWITTIILFILFATIIELLIPSTQFQQYVKMVVGLLLILLLMTPLMSLFSIDKEKITDALLLEQKITKKNLEKTVNEQKKDIEATQSAYIEEQMAVHMVKQVEEELMEQYEMAITQIRIDFEENKDETLEHIKQVHVVIRKDPSLYVRSVERIEKINIKKRPETQRKSHDKTQEIQQFLAREWDISEDKLNIDLDGREES